MNFTIFQGFLITAILAMLFFVRNSNIRSLYRLVIIISLFSGIIFVIKPEWTSIVANFLGIGRGTDLIFYLFIIVVLLKLLTMDATINSMQKKITELIRKNAILNSHKQEKK